MSSSGDYHFGFISTVETESGGVAGGLLILDRAGRPVEFHCSLPVIPDKFQQILYGNCLRSTVINDQVVPALVGKTKLAVDIWLTNQPELQTFAKAESKPWVAVQQSGVVDHGPSPAGIPCSSIEVQGIQFYHLNPPCGPGNHASNSWPPGADQHKNMTTTAGSVHAGSVHADSDRHVSNLLAEFIHLDQINEPFDRIRDAVGEAHAVSHA